MKHTPKALLYGSFYSLLFLLPKLSFAQEIITLDNPSFEGIAQCCNPPFYWQDCRKFLQETPVDVHPIGLYGVTKEAQDDLNYLGMVVRDNNTWECVSQKLNQPLRAGQCYSLSLYLSQSETYLSPTKNDPKKKLEFTKAVRLQISGQTIGLGLSQVLSQSEPVNNLEWKKYDFILAPSYEVDIFVLEAIYTNSSIPYNGHILVDNLSEIVQIGCPN